MKTKTVSQDLQALANEVLDIRERFIELAPHIHQSRTTNTAIAQLKSVLGTIHDSLESLRDFQEVEEDGGYHD